MSKLIVDTVYPSTNVTETVSDGILVTDRVYKSQELIFVTEKDAILPQTNEKANNSLLFVGSLLLVVCCGMYFRKRGVLNE